MLRLTILFVLLYTLSNVVNAQETSDSGDTKSKSYATVAPPNSDSTLFAEIFDNNWKQKWVISAHPDFQGEWAVDEGSEPHRVHGDKGLIVNSIAKKHAISAKFNRILDNKDKEELTIQYELRLQKDLDCGGAYIKLLTASSLPSDLTEFNNEVPYTIMFGPDKCGSTNKVHFIIRHKNPVSGLYEEKHLKDAPSMKTDTTTHLYKLQIRKDNTFSIYIDNISVREGNLLEDFEPPFNPPSEIDDPEDQKPSDWVDEAKIPDTTAVKPDDWDEDAPATIVDESDVKPDEWLDDEPLTIPDPEVTKPDDWDDDLDGDWEAPMVPNPKCKEFGCGEWKPRSIPNPEYKGKWRPPLIDNPAYKGEWAPRKIHNPFYFVDEHPHNLEPIGAIGIELWTMKDGIFFDNILITHDSEESNEFIKETWVLKNADEQAYIDTEIASKKPSFSQQIQDTFELVMQYVSNPDNGLVVAGGVVFFLVILISLICLIPGGGRAKPPPKRDEEEKEKENEKESQGEKKIIKDNKKKKTKKETKEKKE
eukprot:TRINITY_DN504_c0_g1_i1.p1 TRINITY_DN504_c0_g1~~TRINITY_DN504_c0_g1_i1.p1  ORF type:complete len:534 (-),score=145.66 TRINITY_DN504_c0_g1_i1:117-1718(-)